ncbi:MAG TPA: chemotaxis protein CheX [Thermodesulfovibrionales bacterium]|nr:chemotaxis protein CheX [Thermodesulfovibrionales bacterium]
MSIKFFGQYLLEKNLISAEQLLEAVRYQESQNLRFGEYAESRGYITKADIARILTEQKQTDLQFGQLAVRMGILSEDRVKEILVRQKNDHIMIGEAIVQKGFLSKDRIELELAAFKKDQSQYAAGEARVPEGIANPEIVRSFCDITIRMLRQVANITAKSGAGVFMAGEPGRRDMAVRTSMSGDLDYDYVLLATRDAAVQMASGVIGSDASAEPEDIVVDSAKEFCNIVCGNIMAIMAKSGRNVNIGVPELLSYSEKGYGIVKRKKTVSFNIGTTAGNIVLIICDKS